MYYRSHARRSALPPVAAQVQTLLLVYELYSYPTRASGTEGFPARKGATSGADASGPEQAVSETATDRASACGKPDRRRMGSCSPRS